uniref:DNA double-strand break repair Rad50 ATPase n=1 Tax=Rhabditophanes sp. KR3021 TaxID=114890 RepID=A0AC35U2Q5_9BILA
MLKFYLLFFIVPTALAVDYCRTLAACKHDSQLEFWSCSNSSLNVLLDGSARFNEKESCRTKAKSFVAAQNNGIINRYAEAINCIYIKDKALRVGDNLRMKCTILSIELNGKPTPLTIGQATFNECLEMKRLAEDRCNIISKCCPLLSTCNPFYSKRAENKINKKNLIEAGDIITCLDQYKNANEDRVKEIQRKGIKKNSKLVDSTKISDDSKIGVSTKEKIAEIQKHITNKRKEFEEQLAQDPLVKQLQLLSPPSKFLITTTQKPILETKKSNEQLEKSNTIPNKHLEETEKSNKSKEQVSISNESTKSSEQLSNKQKSAEETKKSVHKVKKSKELAKKSKVNDDVAKSHPIKADYSEDKKKKVVERIKKYKAEKAGKKEIDTNNKELLDEAKKDEKKTNKKITSEKKKVDPKENKKFIHELRQVVDVQTNNQDLLTKSNTSKKALSRGLSKAVAKKIFSTWGCKAYKQCRSLVNFSALKCKDPSIELLKNATLPDTKIYENIASFISLLININFNFR